MRSALFLPSYLGGGFGHIGRCLALAQAFTQQGGKAVFALNGPHMKVVAEEGFDIHPIDLPHMAKGSAAAPAYVYVPEMAYQIVRDGFDTRRCVEKALRLVVKIIEKTKPHVLIGDGYPLTWMAGHITGVPVVQLVKSAVHPFGQQMVWWEDRPDDLIVPNVCPVFNPVLNRIGLPEISRRAEELLQGDLLLIPSIPVLDPMDPVPSGTHYVGPIVRSKEKNRPEPNWFFFFRNTMPLVFVTVGGAAGHGGSSRFFDVIIEAFQTSDYQIVISTGGKIDPGIFHSVPSHIKIVRWVPGPEMISRSDCVVFHGGYTRMEVLMNNVPSVVIPFHSEQEYYGRRMEEAGVATVVPLSDEPYVRFLSRWKGGNHWMKSKQFTIYVKAKMTMGPESLITAVEKCLYNKTMKLRAQTIKAELASYGGCEGAIDLIRSRIF